MRFADHAHIYQRLGIDPRRHLPVDGLEPQVINVADERCPPLMMPVHVNPPRKGEHRVIARCPVAAVSQSADSGNMPRPATSCASPASKPTSPSRGDDHDHP